MKWITYFLCLNFILIAAPAEDRIKPAMVKIYCISNSPDYYNPWSMKGPRSSTGSGVIIDGNRILTNAHVISNRTYIQVRRFGQAQRIEARVLAVSHHADLALLGVDTPGFFEGVKGVALGELPETQEDVLVYGFPMGGDTLSTTKGVVSRVEHIRYAHSSLRLLAGQIDNAINPGNSGGPVISSGKIAGVVMQTLGNSDNIGYMVPVKVLKHFLRDLEDGHYDGFPSLGIKLQDMENPDLRRKYKVNEGMTGVLITQVLKTPRPMAFSSPAT
jgi:S1-C subfamily serine protease